MKEKEHWLYRLARRTYANSYIKKHGVTLKNDTGVDFSNGPYLLMSNHVGTHDPIEISAVFKNRMIHWITGAYLFKMPFVGYLMRNVCQNIPKQQGRGDLETMRNIKHAFEKGWIVGIFPEGTRTWDGDLMPVNYHALAKMVRSFKVPVMFVSLEGGYAYEPRWAVKRRKGPVTVHVKKVLTPEEYGAMDIEDLKSVISEHLYFSNDEWKKTSEYKYQSDVRAEGLQRTLYLCPKCNKIETLKTTGNRIVCSSCGFEASLDENDDIVSDCTDFKTVSQWHKWESSCVLNCGGFTEEKGCLFQVGDSNNNGELLDLSKSVLVKLENNTIFVKCLDGIDRVFEFSLDKISSLILNAKQTMEFFFDDRLYRLRLLPDASSLKYYEYYQAFATESKKEL